MKETLAKARVARMKILEKMLSVLPAPRKALSQYAPKVSVVKIPTEKIVKSLDRGKVIRMIMASTETTVDVDDDGSVVIAGTSTSP